MAATAGANYNPVVALDVFLVQVGEGRGKGNGGVGVVRCVAGDGAMSFRRCMRGTAADTGYGTLMRTN